MKLGLETLPPRVVIWTPEECAALVATADRLGLHAVGDASVIALHTAQRLGDVLALQYSKTDRGYVEFRQSKTGARVRVPQTDQLEKRLAAIRRRRTSGAMIALDQIAHVVLRDDTLAPHTGRSFNDAFNTVKRAIADHPDSQAKWFLDFRDTAITRLALAGATLPEIRAISGHKLETIASVLANYLALDHRMADAGVAKLKEWMASEGIAV
jgi:integrase